MKDKTFKEIQEGFYSSHPDCPRPKEIEVLNLIMRREYAEDIINGEKPIELRAYSKHYHDRLIDLDVANYILEHELPNDELELIDLFRPVRLIRFHNYTNSWHLDVECKQNNIIAVTRQNVEVLQKEYNCHEFDKMLADFEIKKDNIRPMFFYFVLGEVRETTLRTITDKTSK